MSTSAKPTTAPYGQPPLRYTATHDIPAGPDCMPHLTFSAAGTTVRVGGTGTNPKAPGQHTLPATSHKRTTR
jgi:hypothetical protein